MYDELVKALRQQSEWNNMEWEDYSDYARETMRTAADAIEELSRAADAIPHVCECCIGCEVESGGCDNAFVLSPKRAKEYLSKPHWISVTERLPKRHKNVLCCGVRGGMFVGWFTNISAISGGKTIAYVHGGNGRNVTHWMPLPQLPKEE